MTLKYLILFGSLAFVIGSASAECWPFCNNGGTCTPANLCLCTENWGGQSCSLPACQGFDCPNSAVCAAECDAVPECPGGEDEMDCGCGGSLNSSEGTFTSPEHPENYPNDANCTWFITVHPGSVIRLAFSSFHLENVSDCRFDSVTVYEEFTGITELGKFCGTTDPGVITSVDNTMMVVFRSDIDTTRNGFVANYVSINTSTDCEVTYSRCSKTCGFGTRSLITDCPDGDPSPTEETCCECPCPPKLPNSGTGGNVTAGGDRKLCRDYSPYKEALACPAPTA